MSAFSLRRAMTPLMVPLLTACFLLTGTPANGRPVVLEETVKLVSPDPRYHFVPGGLAIDGDDLLIAGAGNMDDDAAYFVLFHYRRQGDGEWQFQSIIATAYYEMTPSVYVALKGDLAVFVAGQAAILERAAGAWVSTPLFVPQASRPLIHNGRVAIGAKVSAQHQVMLFAKNSSGEWQLTDTLIGMPSTLDNDVWGPTAIAYAEDEVVFGNSWNDWETSVERAETHVFDLIDAQWQRTQILQGVFEPLIADERIALRLDRGTEPGDIQSFYWRDAAGNWTIKNSLLSEEWIANRLPADVIVQGERAYASSPQDDSRADGAGSIAVFTRHGSGEFTHSATLFASDAGVSTELGFGGIAVSGLTVAVGAYTQGSPITLARPAAVYLFDLPGEFSPSLLAQDDFEDLNSSEWVLWGTGNWRLAAAGGTHVFRQTNSEREARAIFDASESENQAIQADVVVRAVSGVPWAGLMVRYTDPNNFYYLLADYGNQRIDIRKIVNGVYGPIASSPLTLNLNQKRNFRLEVIGTWMRAYVDGELVLQVHDTAHSRGKAGLALWRAKTDFDNVLISSSPKTLLLADSFDRTSEELLSPWLTSPSNVWSYTVLNSGATVFRQTLTTTVAARAINGEPAVDQAITVDVRPRVFNANGFGWVGAIARYIDENNYYYVQIRDDDRIVLGKRIDGVSVVLDEMPMTIKSGASYRVRLEAIGSKLRGYVRNKLLEAENSELPRGRYGLEATYTDALFDNFSATRP